MPMATLFFLLALAGDGRLANAATPRDSPPEPPLPLSASGVLGAALIPPTLGDDGAVRVAVSGPAGLYFTSTGEGAVVATAVRASLPAAAQGLGPGSRVTELDAKPLKSLGTLQRALAAAAADSSEGGSGNVTLTVAPPQPVLAASAKQRRRGLKRSSSAAKKLRAAAKAGADGAPDGTDAFFAAAQELSTMGEALRLAEAAGDGEGGGIDLEKVFAVPSPQGGGSQRTALLPHVLSLVTRTMGLLGGVKLGLAQGTSRHHSAELSESGAAEAVALSKWLARRVAHPGQPSAAGYSPVFYATALREYELLHVLAVERGVSVDEAGPNPYLPTPFHVLLQLPDERVQLARELLRRNSAASKRQDGTREDTAVPPQFGEGVGYSVELRALFEAASGAGGALHTLSTADLAAGVHSWQLPFVVLLLAHSTDGAALCARPDAWQRNAAHMAARSGNSRAVGLLPLDEAALSAPDFMGRTPLHSAAMYGYSSTVAALLAQAERVLSPPALARLTGARDKSGHIFDQMHPRGRPAVEKSPRLKQNPDDSGGWKDHSTADNNAEAAQSGCGIDVCEGISSAEFLLQYLAPGRPVLLRRAAAKWPFRDSWSKAALLRQHGDLVLPSAAIPYAASFASNASAAVREGTLADFIEQMSSQPAAAAAEEQDDEDTEDEGSVSVEAMQSMKLRALIKRAEQMGVDDAALEAAEDKDQIVALLTAKLRQQRPAATAAESEASEGAAPPYIFFDGVADVAPQMLEAFPTVPPFLEFESAKMVERKPAAIQWYLGPRNSGAPIHFHGDAWNALAHGRKRWLLLPPAEARYSAQPISQWLQEDAAQLERLGQEPPLECVQEAGDVLYVPCDWGHGVLNLEASVGVAVEFTWGYGQRG